VSNRIDSLNGGGPAAIGAGQAANRPQEVAGATTAAGSASSGGGNVSITDAATRLSSLEKALREAPAIDEARVAQLRSAIEQGTYTVQPEKVATGLLQMEHALRPLASGPGSPGAPGDASPSAKSGS
jgi:negative regulator of flagellin synthesis FlgM